MDPVSMSLLAALQKLSEPLVKDAYNGIKALIARKFGQESRIAAAVEEVEAQPSSAGRAAVLEEEVVAAGADRDPELLEAVRSLTTAISGAAPTVTVTQNVSGSGHTFSGSGDIHINRP